MKKEKNKASTEKKAGMEQNGGKQNKKTYHALKRLRCECVEVTSN